MRWVLLLLGAGCGRVRFEPNSNDGGNVPTTDVLADSTTLGAITVTFGERANATFRNVTSDTYISNEAGEPLLNFGASDDLRSEQDVSERILVRFDVSAIPASAQIQSAHMTVNITQFGGGATISARPVLEQWTEGALDGVAGVSNFQFRTMTQAWTTLGAGNPGSSGATVGSATPTASGDLVVPIEAQTIQAWVATPATNFGVVFFNASTQSVRFASREDTTAAVRPLLTVTYLP